MSDCAKSFVSTFIKDLNNPNSKVYNYIAESIREGYSGTVASYNEYSGKYPCTKKLSLEDQHYANKEMESTVPKIFKFDMHAGGFTVQWRH